MRLLIWFLLLLGGRLELVGRLVQFCGPYPEVPHESKGCVLRDSTLTPPLVLDRAVVPTHAFRDVTESCHGHLEGL